MSHLEQLLSQEVVSISDAITLVRGLNYHSLSHLTNTSSASWSELKREVASSETVTSTISYSLMPGEMAQSSTIDYEQLWYGDRKTSPPSFSLEDEYWSPTAVSDVQSEVMSDEEAQKTIVDIQYATLSGHSLEIDSEERRRLNLWIMFNPAQFKMTESLYSVTSNVDYRPLA